MAAQENWWDSSPVVAKPNQVQQVPGGIYVPPAPEKPEKPEKPTETFSIATPEQKAAAGLDPNRVYQVGSVTGEFKDVGGQPTAKAVAEKDTNRLPQLYTGISAVRDLRKLSDKFLSLGKQAAALAKRLFLVLYLDRIVLTLRDQLKSLKVLLFRISLRD
jgi:hypothetical protein